MWQKWLLDWYWQNKRDLPWRRTKNPYHIWVSEIMLQQTRVETVKGYYQRFLAAFPNLQALASAPEDELNKLWEGLGYYSRARNLQKAAQVIMQAHHGIFPHSYNEIEKLPGIGPYTAGAIASIAFGIRVPAVDGNVNRVMTRFFGIREPIERPAVKRRIYQTTGVSVPQENAGDFNQALMELGATLCSAKTPKCEKCPLQACCNAFLEGDAELLPVHEKKPKPKQVDMGVVLLTYHNRILVIKRTEQLLHGLYVFCLLEGVQGKKAITEQLKGLSLHAKNLHKCAEAKHVFTHRVWNMTIYYAVLSEEPVDFLKANPQAKLIDANELEHLPFPTAMEAARKIAAEKL